MGLAVAERRKGITPMGTKRVLVVDDEKLVRNLIEKALQRMAVGVQVETACSAEEGVRKFGDRQNEGTPFDMVITDVDMGTMTGPEGVQHMQALHKGDRPLGVVFMTANQDAKGDIKALGIPYDLFALKPFQLVEFVGTISAILRGENPSE